MILNIDLTTEEPVPTLPLAAGHSMIIPVDSIDPNPQQPRQDFDPEALGELAASITQHGLIQPITVEPVFPSPSEGEGPGVGSEIRYILHDGERRLLRAIKKALEETIDLALLELEEARNVQAEISLDGVDSVAILAALPPDSTGSPPPQGLQDRP